MLQQHSSHSSTTSSDTPLVAATCCYHDTSGRCMKYAYTKNITCRIVHHSSSSLYLQTYMTFDKRTVLMIFADDIAPCARTPCDTKTSDGRQSSRNTGAIQQLQKQQPRSSIHRAIIVTMAADSLRRLGYAYSSRNDDMMIKVSVPDCLQHHEVSGCMTSNSKHMRACE